MPLHLPLAPRQRRNDPERRSRPRGFNFTLAGGSATGGWAYFGTYFAARTLHTFFYLNGVQPWRTAFFGLGQLTMVGVGVQLLLRAFGHGR